MSLPNDTLVISHFDTNVTSELRIGVIYEQPYSTYCSLKSECPVRGYGVEAAIYVCQLMHLNCTFQWFHSQDYGRLDDGGNWTGMLHAISSGHFDTSLPIFTPNPTRYELVAFSEPYFFTDVFLVTRMPAGVMQQSQVLTMDILHSFQWPVWCSFLAAFLIISILMMTPHMIGHVSEKNAINGTNVRSVAKSAAFTMLRLVGGERLKRKSFSNRLGIILWGILTLVLSSTYTSVMFSQRVVYRQDLPYTNIRSFITCLERRKCKIIDATISHSTVQHFINEATYSAKIRHAMTKNPIAIVPNDQIGMTILNEKSMYYVAIVPRPIFVQITDDNLGCRFYVMKTKLTEINGFPLRKEDIVVRKSLDRMAAIFRDLGMSAALESRYGLNDNACPHESFIFYKPTQESAISLSALSSVFSIYILGITAAAVCSLGEVLPWIWDRAKIKSSETSELSTTYS